MAKISGATTAIILAITLYFTLFWGFDAVRILASSSYGLDDTFRSQYIFIIGRMLDLGPVQLLKVAAFLGGVKFIVAGACAWFLVDRFRALFRGQPNSDVLEGAMILVVALSILSAGFAARAGNGEIVREYAIQLGLAFIATAAIIFERTKTNKPDAAVEAEEGEEAIEATTTVAAGGRWFSPWR